MYWIFYEVDDPSPEPVRWNGQQCRRLGRRERSRHRR
jgi:hypothetical protein